MPKVPDLATSQGESRKGTGSQGCRDHRKYEEEHGRDTGGIASGRPPSRRSEAGFERSGD